MCGRFAVTVDPALLAGELDAVNEIPEQPGDSATPADGPGPNYNVAPTTGIAGLVRRHDRQNTEATAAGADASGPFLARSSLVGPAVRRLRLMRWGLVPPWTKATADGKPAPGGPLLINARAETLTTSRAFSAAAQRKRCLIPMDGWYEWRGPKGDKTPFYLYATDGKPLLMAGVWSVWHPPGENAPALLSATIITTEAVGPLADIHDRMPLSISAPDWDRWLDPDSGIDEGLLRGHGDLDRIAIREVSTLVNSATNNGPELIAPAEPKSEQTELF
ncbi:SOS response-associated peptidase [Mycolicibacterium brumae]|uniref:Abasic site processing protein n=1 Tax=Mycolicibacterium brumae TaxID=85968 RepID=A0A2G5PC15_9MYCO|nr:SOS response-associated peptidase [Mycolicibacterium brumae]MCV7193204.1 SOS response-associated peptidase [Mycolicibacterium brumae]PIB75888.1 SOS response-associated peptidase [Mycolicibacterium brumae]RWA16641.1 hypothetical protein MBRU_07915 [Mycolicibacterium brumae DSM 44177]UWW09859.1 SOS response-associated peptidase [Mycolicibacterium brumae]